MDVVLIDPPTSHAQIYGDWDLSKVDTYSPPLGLLSIAAFVRSHGHEPHVLDIATRGWSIVEVVEFVKRIRPGIVGLSAKTINILNAATIGKEIKAAMPGTLVVLGGAHVTAEPLATLARFREFDIGVIGEGEITFLELVERKDRGADLSAVAGTAYRDDFGEPVANPRRALISNLDELPFPAWDLLPGFPGAYKHSALETKRLPSASIMTSRGCPFSCTFCDNAVFGTRVRHHSAQYTLAMIRHLEQRYAVKDLMFLDDNFLLNPDKVAEICDALIHDGDDLTWYCIGHAKFMTDDVLRKIREAGCWFIELGIESGCDRILRLLKKNTSKAEIAAAVARARSAGLKVKGNFIFGLPTETRESLEETTAFALDIHLTHFQQNFLTIWPGCELSVNPAEHGTFAGDWENMAHQRITFVPHGLTEAELIAASKKAFRRFYLRPRIILELLKELRSLRAARGLMLAFVAFLGTVLRRLPNRNRAHQEH